MQRDIIKKLYSWKNSASRKPLVLQGARQVGKTTALKHFGNEAFNNAVYLNFERDERLAAYFEKSLDPVAIIKTLSLHSGINIDAKNTLIIFDEVQECPQALNSLKYFCEEAREYHIVAAGSLLGVKTAHHQGFPVGKVNFLSMYPMTFFEFLSAMDKPMLREHLESLQEFQPLNLHEQLMLLLKEYFFVGGMPEVVATYISSGDYEKTREVQWEIIEAYQRDFAKHAPSHQIMKITQIWDRVHQQLAKENKKFIFSAIKKSARAREYEESIQWLLETGIIYKALNISAPNLPLDAYADNQVFKIYLLDIGLLGAKSHLSAKTIIQGNNLFKEFKGALTENFIAGELMAQGDKQLYYWTSTGTAEVDFIREVDGSVYPLEVKAGENSYKRSLLVFGEKYPDVTLSRATAMNLKHDGKVWNYPLYLISQFPMEM